MFLNILKISTFIRNTRILCFFENIRGNHYHPNELCAEIMSIYYLRQMNISHQNFKSKSYDKFVEWFKSYIKLI